MNGGAVALSCVIAGSLALRGWLTLRQIRCLRAHRGSDTRAAEFGVMRTRSELFYATVEALWVALLLPGGGLSVIERFWAMLPGPPVVSGTTLVLSVLGLRGAMRLLWSAHRVFVVDQRFGLNRRRPGRFLTDALKRAVLTTAETLPTVVVVVWALGRSDVWALAAAWALWFAIVLFRSWLGPVLVQPLLIRYTPLAAPALAARLQALGSRAGLPAITLVECSSALSSRANAAARGFGRLRRVIVSDTLLNLLAEDEIEAVVAHELGHLAHRHMAFYLAAVGLAGASAFAALGYLAAYPQLGAGLGVATTAGVAAGLPMILPSFGFFLRAPAAAALRRMEYAADDFATRHADGAALARALDKLGAANGTGAASDPLYAAIFSSHPSPSERYLRLLRHAWPRGKPGRIQFTVKPWRRNTVLAASLFRKASRLRAAAESRPATRAKG